jgi:hypothetical protein
MLDLVTRLRDSSRFLPGALALAVALLSTGLLTLAPSALQSGDRGADPARAEGLEGSRSAGSPPRRSLARGRAASEGRRGHLSRRAVVVRRAAVRPDGGYPGDPGGPEPVGQLVAAVTPAAEAGATAPGPTAPDPSPSPPLEPSPSPPLEPSPPPAPSPSPAPRPSPPPPSPPGLEPGGQVLFKATFDSSGFVGWYVQSLPGRATTTSSDPFEGRQAARFEVRDGDVEPDTGSERSEVSGPTFNEGEDLFIRDAIRFPGTNTYSAPWQIVQQLHEEDWGGSPGLAVFLDNKPSLKLAAGDPPPTFWQSATLSPDRWYDLIYRVHLSQGPSKGFVEVWLGGVQQVLANEKTRMYGQTIQAPQTYIKAGIYRSRSTTGTSIVEHDTIVIGTSLAAVSAAG